MALFNVEIEQYLLSGLLQFPITFGELELIGSEDFSKVNQPIFSVIKQQLSQNPPAAVSPIILAEKLKSYNITLDGVDAYDYLEGLRIKNVKQSEIVNYAKELKKLTISRQLSAKCDEIKAKLASGKLNSFQEITGVVEEGLSSITTSYYKETTIDVFENLASDIEALGNNPIDVSQIGYMGPFDSINRTIGGMNIGDILLLIARTGVGKSSLTFFYAIHMAEKYGLPIIWCDAAEMTLKQLQYRAACALSKGRVPLWAVRSGQWRENAVWTQIMRGEVLPRFERLKMYLCDVGQMNPAQKISFFRKFYYNKIGRGNDVIIVEDYLKGVESMAQNKTEFQAMGYYVGDVKSLITNEIPAIYCTSLQSNRSGITAGKKVSDIQDSGESAASISDRIIQQATLSLLMRFKVPEELAVEKNLFGNMVLKPAKVREGLGKEYEKISRPVKLANGQFAMNYFNIDTRNFYYEDRGLYSDVLDATGQNTIDMTDNKGKDKKGL